jgi:preprotein translocase subunit Sec61beta
MARDDNIRMPSSSAGVMSFYDEERSRIRIMPMHVVILTALVCLIAILLNYTSIFKF